MISDNLIRFHETSDYMPKCHSALESQMIMPMFCHSKIEDAQEFGLFTDFLPCE
jgi:hypothetical protein